MEEWKTNLKSNDSSSDTREKVLVWVLYIERWMVLPCFIYILIHWKKHKAGWPRLQFNMIVLGDILRMIILFIQCGLRVSTHDDFHVLNEVSFYINNLSHEWRDIWEVIVVIVIFKYLMMPFNNRIQFKMRNMIVVSVVYVAVVGLLLDWYYTNVILESHLGREYRKNYRYGYSLTCFKEKVNGTADLDFDRIIYSGFMTTLTVAFLLIWVAAMIIGLQFRKMKLWFECHHMNQLLLIIGLFSLFTFPPKLFGLISKFDSDVLNSKYCNDVLLIVNIVSSTRVLLDIYMWQLCARFQTSVDYDVEISPSNSAQSRNYSSITSLVSNESEKIHPSAEKYFKNRIIMFMRTTIVELLKNKLDLDQPQHLDQFKKIKLQDTNIECTEVYPGHFAILRGAVWKIDSKKYIDSFERGFGQEQINFRSKGSVFFLTEDQKYIIKSLTRTEYKNLLKIFQEYYNFNHANKGSSLIRFLGLFRVRVMKFQPLINIVIIENINHQRDAYSSSIYNMMSSTIDDSQIGFSSSWGGQVVLPRSFSNLMVTESRDTSYIQNSLAKDLKFLKNNNCMHYRLLVVEYHISSSNRIDGREKLNQFLGVQVVSSKITSAVRLYKFFLVNIVTQYDNSTEKLFRSSKKVKAYAEPFLPTIKAAISNNYQNDYDASVEQE